jgi:pSer/pThr/pTyr-binding forkhead associated (FHA) protein
VKDSKFPKWFQFELSMFLAKFSNLNHNDFLSAVSGPLLMYRHNGEASQILVLGRVVEADKTRILLGRAADCDICFGHLDISGHHVELLYKRGVWSIKDLNSTNGTFCGDRIQSNVPVVMEDKAKYKMANVVQLQFWKLSSFYGELRAREQISRKLKIPDLNNDPSKNSAGRNERTTRRYTIHGSGERDLLKLSKSIRKMTRAQFREQFPFPFLVKLTASTSHLIGPVDETVGAEKLVTNRGLRDLKYWPINLKENSSKITIGRGPSNDLIIDHATVSQCHGVFGYNAATDRWTIEDLKSKNGILLDGQAITKAVQLEDEVCLRFGKEVLLQFMDSMSFHKLAKLYTLTQKGSE